MDRWIGVGREGLGGIGERVEGRRREKKNERMKE